MAEHPPEREQFNLLTASHVSGTLFLQACISPCPSSTFWSYVFVFVFVFKDFIYVRERVSERDKEQEEGQREKPTSRLARSLTTSGLILRLQDHDLS